MPAPLTMAEVLRVPVMRRLWYAQLVSTFGDFLALFAVINFLTFQLHANAEQVTGLQIAYMAPIAVLGILAGVFVDRWPLKPTMVASDLTRAGLCLLLLFAHSTMSFYAIMAAISVV
jgi:MFS family permease